MFLVVTVMLSAKLCLPVNWILEELGSFVAQIYNDIDKVIVRKFCFLVRRKTLCYIY